MILPFFSPLRYFSWMRVGEAKHPSGKMSSPDSGSFSNAESDENPSRVVKPIRLDAQFRFELTV